MDLAEQTKNNFLIGRDMTLRREVVSLNPWSVDISISLIRNRVIYVFPLGMCGACRITIANLTKVDGPQKLLDVQARVSDEVFLPSFFAEEERTG
jgi:hypothetical protein